MGFGYRDRCEWVFVQTFCSHYAFYIRFDSVKRKEVLHKEARATCRRPVQI